jgi:hypothetical protein
MGSQTRKEVYTYSSKVAGPAGIGISTWVTNFGLPTAKFGMGLQLFNPVNLVTIEGLVTHFRASGITAGATIIAIGIADADVSPFVNVKELAVSIPQDGSGIIDFSKSLAGLLLPTKNNVVNLMFDRNTSISNLEMWKNDMLYTVLGLH